ncbi:hypothetical protein BV25DRAFT_341301 [Artomyces pyxidatus]|uniref:Uncharacterized protein n=1 Tax=Artomyces pyxidatus TaxID=48021 RepID=A0ACB8T5T4_9AGAM|nr:hypothetical protein BV25DRAFT_341301 [Artomyces pyxidatus]
MHLPPRCNNIYQLNTFRAALRMAVVDISSTIEPKISESENTPSHQVVLLLSSHATCHSLSTINDTRHATVATPRSSTCSMINRTVRPLEYGSPLISYRPSHSLRPARSRYSPSRLRCVFQAKASKMLRQYHLNAESLRSPAHSPTRAAPPIIDIQTAASRPSVHASLPRLPLSAFLCACALRPITCSVCVDVRITMPVLVMCARSMCMRSYVEV